MTKEPNKSTPSIIEVGRNIVQERFFFFIILIILIILTLMLLWPNMIAILTALALVVLVKPLYTWFEKKESFKDKPNKITLATLISFLLLIAIPLITFIWISYSQASALFNTSATDETVSANQFIGGVDTLMASLSESEDITVQSQELLKNFQESVSTITNNIAQVIAGLMGWMAQFFTSIAIILVIMMVLLPKYKKPKQSMIETIIPFPKDITNLYIEKTQLMIMAMFKGTFLIAIIQGFAMGVVFFIAGVPYVFLLSISSMFLSLLPMIGISLIAWPIGIAMILAGHIWQGIFIILAFLIVVANIDVVLRPILVPKEVSLNPALVILSVFGGLKLMGIIGLIYGPVIMILLITSLEVYTKYIMKTDLAPFMNKDGSLDLEKMGLKEKEESTEDVAANVIQRVSNSIFKRSKDKKD